MTLNRLTPIHKIEIWQPRWKDRVVLIACHKVKQDNIIVFTKTKSLPDEYYLSGSTIREFPVETNGTIDCYAVPIRELEAVQRV